MSILLSLVIGFLEGLLGATSQDEESSTPREPTPTRWVTYKEIDDVTLRMAVFEPNDHEVSDRRAAVVFFFGGGWNSGSPSQFYPHCAHLASHGLVAMAAEYRVKTRNQATPFDCVRDAKSALRWLRSHAKELGIDPDRIGAGGGSAGGHLAAATGTLDAFEPEGEDFEVSSRPNALLLFNPVYDNGPKGYGHDRVKEKWKSFSPAHNLTPETPPTLVFLGTQDRLIPVETARAYDDRLEELGVIHELHLYEGMGHGFFNPGRYEGKPYRDTLKKMDAFLERVGFLGPSLIVRPIRLHQHRRM